jgi:hypothetical protein
MHGRIFVRGQLDWRIGMRRTGHLMLGLVACLIALGGTLAGDKVKLEGGYVWNRTEGNLEGKLEAVFTSTGSDQWDVTFRFDWEDGPHVWSGTAQGNLKSGDLSGKVLSDGDQATEFEFDGSFEGSTFNGTHAQVRRNGEPRATGTLSLGPGS